jgi:hypothetical protein
MPLTMHNSVSVLRRRLKELASTFQGEDVFPSSGHGFRHNCAGGPCTSYDRVVPVYVDLLKIYKHGKLWWSLILVC